MIILGITGSICAGKKTAADYLQICYGFKVINLESEEWDIEGNHCSNYHTEEDFDNEILYREANVRVVIKNAEQNLSANYVVYPITLPEELAIFRELSNFMMIGIDTPTLKRYGFYNVKYVIRKSALGNFLELDDKINFGINSYPSAVHECLYLADKIVLNIAERDSLYEELRALDVLNPEHYRPSWDTYFMRIAEMTATRTNCMKRGVGAVIVLNNRLISAGYNGTPAGTVNCIDGGCVRCNSQAVQGTMLEDCMCMHGELNAILFAGFENCKGCTLYTTLYPCLLCSKSIVQSGIVRIVYQEEYNHSELSTHLLTQAGVRIDRHSAAVPSQF